jgi:DNA-directed RNA polymerase specialized sigma24 family protein
MVHQGRVQPLQIPLASAGGRTPGSRPLLGGRPVAVPARDVASVVTVHAALATLTPRQRAAVVLRFFADLDVGTTATVMGCSTGTVKKLTARGIATLRPLLEFDDLAGGDDA